MRYTKYITRDGEHLVDSLTDVTCAKTGRIFAGDSAPFDIAVLIPPYATRAVRAGEPRRRQVRAPKQLMRVRA